MDKELTRKQKRHQERVSEEAKEVYEQFCKRFLDFIIFSDSTTEEGVKAKMGDLSKKWRLYCKQKNLLPAIYTIVDDYMNSVLLQYSDMDQKKEEGFGIVEPKKVDDGIPT